MLKSEEESHVDNKYSKHDPNIWLISNSTFYFADGLLRDPYKTPSANDIFNLSKLAESLLLAEKITTLPV